MGWIQLDNSTLHQERWNTLLAGCKTATFYQTFQWCSLWEKSFDYCRSKYFVYEEQGKYIWGLPLVEIKKRGFRSYFSMPLGTYGGLLGRNWSEAEAEKLLAGVPAILTKPTTLRFQIVDFENNLSILKQKGFAALQATAHIINLQKVNLEELLNKRGYQQASKKALTARKISTDSDLNQCYEIYLLACRRHRSKPKYPDEFYRNLFADGMSSDWLLWWVAEFEDKIVGYQINFNYRNQLIMWDAGFEPDNLNLRASDYLMGESLKWCKKNKIANYNLGGSPVSAEGLVHFKEQWGGKIKQYYTYEKTFLFGQLSDLLRGR